MKGSITKIAKNDYICHHGLIASVGMDYHPTFTIVKEGIRTYRQ